MIECSRGVALPLLAVAAAGCGLSGVRRSQDWSAVSDARLDLACHVDGYGSGVLVSCDEGGARVLTCAHLVEDDSTVSVYFRDRGAGAWVSYEASVVRRTHPHREDLALLEIRTPAFHLTPRVTPIAEPPPEGSEFTASVVNIAFGAEKRPLVLDLPALSHVSAVTTVNPDSEGRTSWRIAKTLVHGGVREANSGSPVFVGDALLGLAESAPGFAARPGGSLLVGVTVTAPASVREVLAEAGRDAAAK